ncbi:Fur family transcriptional regulator [[Eubacterium] cellulosolvens]
MARTRNTKQKRLIEDEIRKFTTFFTAEDVYDKVKKRDSKIGIATVYRYLNDIERDNKPHSYYCDRRKIYSFNKNNHCHFVCDICKKVKHFNIEKIDFLKRSLNGRICHFQIDVYGICDDCAKAGGNCSSR